MHGTDRVAMGMQVQHEEDCQCSRGYAGAAMGGHTTCTELTGAQRCK